MLAANKPVSANDEKQLPAATFKTSLRAWQARYKAQGDTHASMPIKVHRQAPSPGRLSVCLLPRMATGRDAHAGLSRGKKRKPMERGPR
jgi:hypothetical protein